MDTSTLPEHMWDGVRGYYEHGWKPGSFLYAVLTNDLVNAAVNADDQNRRKLFEWASFLYNELPRECWGDSNTVVSWIKKGGKQGAKREERK